MLNDFKIPHLLILTGPSCAGKSTILRHIKSKHPDFGYAISATTRTPRPGETAEDYTFLSQGAFDSMVANGEFLEYNTKYGTPFSALYHNKDRECIVLDVDYSGAKKLRARYPATIVFLIPPSLQTTEERLRRRGTSPEEFQNRIISGYQMLHEAWSNDDDVCDFYIVSDQTAINDIEAIVHTIQLKRSSPTIKDAAIRYIAECEAKYSRIAEKT